MSLNDHEPMPVRTSEVDIWRLVIADMEERNRVGHQRYGGSLTPFDGRNSPVDLYQELLDAAVYCRKWIYEVDTLKEQVAALRAAQKERR